MKNNLWMYSSETEMEQTAASLIVFGAGVLKRAKIVNQLDDLKQICHDLNCGKILPNNPIFMEYCFEYLIDSVRIIIFFENYMKAEMVTNGFCVHLLNKDIHEFETLAREQRRRPVSTKEIHEILPFEIDEKGKTVFHRAIKETTIGFSELIGNSYSKYYRLDQSILSFVSDLNRERNKLHLHSKIEFKLSNELIQKISLINEFVDNTIQRLISKNSINLL